AGVDPQQQEIVAEARSHLRPPADHDLAVGLHRHRRAAVATRIDGRKRELRYPTDGERRVNRARARYADDEDIVSFEADVWRRARDHDAAGAIDCSTAD